MQRLVSGARRIAAGDYSVKVEAASRDELGELAGAFNDMARDVRDREQRITYQALHDDLTGLPNRTLFDDRLRAAIAAAERSGSPVAVLLLDLDRFKEINDALGHHHGDEVLKLVGARLRAAVRQSDLMARFGGDEYAAVLVDTPAEAAAALGGKLRTALAEPLEIEGLSLDVSGSIGVSVYPEHGGDAATILQRADLAMVRAKKERRGVEVYAPRGDEPSVDRLALASDLRRAVADGELELYYQPQIELATGRANHVEALVRWNHPERGFMPPNEFIPLAEHTGYIRLITHWAISEAVRQCAEWRLSGLEMGVSVNLSPLDFLDSDLESHVEGPLIRHGLDPEALVLEITETAAMTESLGSQDALVGLRKLGVGLAIDDFGTGYSSLERLKDMPVGELKIDRSFVSSMDEVDDDAVLVRSAVDLAHNLGLQVVAEGVETAECTRRLIELRCEYAQGYLFSAPKSASEITAWLQAWHASPRSLARVLGDDPKVDEGLGEEGTADEPVMKQPGEISELEPKLKEVSG